MEDAPYLLSRDQQSMFAILIALQFREIERNLQTVYVPPDLRDRSLQSSRSSRPATHDSWLCEMERRAKRPDVPPALNFERAFC